MTWSHIPKRRIRWAIAACIMISMAAIASLAMRSSPLARPSAARTIAAADVTVSYLRGTGALDPRISSLAGRHPNREIDAIVQFGAAVPPSRAREDVRRVHGTVTAPIAIIRGFDLRLSARQARDLASSRDVRSVSLNSSVTIDGAPQAPDAAALQTTFNASLNSPALWHAGGTGSRVGVAVIDTGIDGQLPDFRSSHGNRSRVIATAVVNPDATTVMDTYGHGTDVAGIVAGNGANRDASDPLRGRYAGVAPDANLVAIKVADDNGNATVLNVIYGIQFAIDHRARYNIRVINLSLDSTTAQSYRTDPLDAAVEAAWLHGITVVVAAGNRGSDSDAVQYAPANDPFVITVGASDENGSTVPSAHTLAGWSSRGTTQDGFAKPDVIAPGAHIVSDLAPSSAFAQQCSACIVDGQYIRASGTSMSAPMVSGLVADLLQVHPDWTPDQVKGALSAPSVQSDSLPEVDALKLSELTTPPSANQDLTPSSLLVDGSHGINWSKSSWSKSSWSKSSWSAATGGLSADFAKSSWSCTCGGAGASVDPSKSSWSGTSWETVGN